MTGAFVVAAVGAGWLLLGQARRARAPHLYASASSPPPSPASCSSSRPAIATASWSPSYQPVGARRHGGKIRIGGARRAGDHRPARRRRTSGSTIRSSCPASSAFSPTARSAPPCAASTTSRATSGPTTSSCSTTATTSWSGSARSSSPIMLAALLLLWRGRLERTRGHALDPDAGLPVPLHRDHRRLDDRRARPPAVARLRPDAHRRTAPRPTCSRRQRRLLDARLDAASTSCSASLFLALVAREIARGPGRVAVEEHH